MIKNDTRFINSFADLVNGPSIVFYPCPELYCCPIGERCDGKFNSCAKGRTGPLCGDCENGFVIPIIGYGCIQETDCNVIGFIVLLLVLTPIWLLALKYVKVLVKGLLKIGRRHREGGNRRRENNQNVEPERNQAQEHDEHIGYILDEPCCENADRISPFGQQPQNQRQNPNGDNRTDVFIVSLLEIIFTFYQIAYAIRVRTAYKIKHHESLAIDILTTPFTAMIDAVPPSNQYCAALTRDAFAVEGIKISPLLFSFCILLTAITILKIKEWFGKMNRRPANPGEAEPLIRYQKLD